MNVRKRKPIRHAVDFDYQMLHSPDLSTAPMSIVQRDSNGALGIANREYVTNEDRSIALDPDKLALVEDEHVVMALRMEAEFGLRREEAIKFTPSRDDRGDRIRLKGSTTKGGRPREIPVRNEGQRRLLDEARRLAGGGALIPPDRNYKQQLKVSTKTGRGRRGCTACTGCGTTMR